MVKSNLLREIASIPDKSSNRTFLPVLLEGRYLITTSYAPCL